MTGWSQLEAAPKQVVRQRCLEGFRLTLAEVEFEAKGLVLMQRKPVVMALSLEAFWCEFRVFGLRCGKRQESLNRRQAGRLWLRSQHHQDLKPASLDPAPVNMGFFRALSFL